MTMRHTPNIKENVRRLILSKKSYHEITQVTGVPKSTISTWFGKAIDKPWTKKAQRKHLENIRKLAAAALTKKWAEYHRKRDRLTREKVRAAISSIRLHDRNFQKTLLAMLYWAEGAKYKGASGPQFVNTDPELMLLYMTLLRKCYRIDETKVRVNLHIHHYHSQQKTKEFWSQKLKVSLKRFGKTHVKKRSTRKRFRKNFAGICLVYYGDSMIREELMRLGANLGHMITSTKSPQT